MAYARRAGRSPLVPHRDSRSRPWRVPREGFILGPPRPRRRRTNHQPRATTAAVHTATASPPPAARRRGARRRYGYGSGSGFSRQVIEIESSRRAVSGWPRVTTDRNGPSRQFAAPAHQRAAVDAYLSGTRVGLPPASGYNASNRAYPDVSAVGVSGTSQSCPIMAGLFGLLTDARLQVRAEVPLTAPTTIHRSFLRAPRGRAPEGARDTARRRLHFLVDFISSLDRILYSSRHDLTTNSVGAARTTPHRHPITISSPREAQRPPPSSRVVAHADFAEPTHRARVRTRALALVTSTHTRDARSPPFAQAHDYSCARSRSLVLARRACRRSGTSASGSTTCTTRTRARRSRTCRRGTRRCGPVMMDDGWYAKVFMDDG